MPIIIASHTWTQRPSVLRALLAGAISVVGLIYAVVAIGTGDYLWFVQRSFGTPDRIVVYFGGDSVVLTDSDPRFVDISRALNVSLSQILGYPQNLGLSEASLDAYRQQEWVVEAHYTEPLVLHSRFRFGRPHQVLIPLSGAYSKYSVVFLGNDDVFYTGPMLKSIADLRRTLKNQGLAPRAISILLNDLS